MTAEKPTPACRENVSDGQPTDQYSHRAPPEGIILDENLDVQQRVTVTAPGDEVRLSATSYQRPGESAHVRLGVYTSIGETLADLTPAEAAELGERLVTIADALQEADRDGC